MAWHGMAGSDAVDWMRENIHIEEWEISENG
jgi:hypothetical protein